MTRRRLDDPARMAVAATHRGLDGTCVGRAWLPPSACPQGIGGPTPVAIRRDGIYDLSPFDATIARFVERPDAAALTAGSGLTRLGSVEDALVESHHARRRPDRLHLLAPIDLQVIKAAGVTFAASLIERVIEGLAEGDPERAITVRDRLAGIAGGRLERIRPGTPEAHAMLDELRSLGLASPYLVVGLGQYAEIFTKAPVLSAVGTGERIGVRSDSTWNNPEPEVVVVVERTGRIVGATVGNDVNLRDLEGLSPLLLGIAKDATASCALGPWIRLFDDSFGLADLLTTDVRLEIEGTDDFVYRGVNHLAEISRDPLDLVEQASGSHHAYPDGFVLFLGTMLVPTVDRADAGHGFAHRSGDLVRIDDPAIGTLVNWVEATDRLSPWAHGIGWLMDNLARRGLIGDAA